MSGRPSKFKPGDSSNAPKNARPAKRARESRASDRVPKPRGNRVNDAPAQDRRDGVARQVGSVPAAQDSTLDRRRDSVPHTAATSGTLGSIVGEHITVDVFQANGYTPEYVKPGKLSGFFARRTGKRIHQLTRLWFGKKEKQVVSPQEQKAQELKFNVSTAAGKGVDPLLSKKAAGVVALITMVLSGYMGHEVAVDQMSIDAAIQQGVAIWMAVNTLIAGVTWFYKVFKNIYTEWGHIRKHGVKVAGPNADLAFEFGTDEIPQNGDTK